MSDVLIQLSPLSLSLVPLVIGLVAIEKNYLDSRYAPVSALILGIATSFLVPAASPQLTILQGILVGLMAAGVYSGTKTTFSSGAPATFTG